MTQGERVKKLRKSLELTTEKFGEKLGVQRSAISKIENGRCSLTDANIRAICREFRVNYYWLTEGQLPMILETPKTITDELAEEYNLDDIDKKIIEKYLELQKDDRKTIKEYLKSIFT